MQLPDKVLAYEQGEMSDEDTVAFFQELVDTGLAWQFQGSYGREAMRLIDAGEVIPARLEDLGLTHPRW